jgi:hypothetical protein
LTKSALKANNAVKRSLRERFTAFSGKDTLPERRLFGIADLKYDFLIVWRTERATQSKNHIWSNRMGDRSHTP